MPTVTSPATAIVGAARPTANSLCPPSTAAPPSGSPASQPSRADPPEKEGVEVGERKEIKSPSTVMDGVVDRPATDLQKKVRRAERFGMAVVLSEQEKRNSRAERFGTGPPLHGATIRNLEQQKRKARAERFGLAAQPVTDVETKKKARLESFAQNSKPFTSEEEKRKARAARFSQTSTASSATNEKVQKNVVANVSEGTGKIVGTAR